MRRRIGERGAHDVAGGADAAVLEIAAVQHVAVRLARPVQQGSARADQREARPVVDRAGDRDVAVGGEDMEVDGVRKLGRHDLHRGGQDPATVFLPGAVDEP